MFKLTRKSFYILLFSILWLITAFSSFFHAVEFFELSNVTWMGIILALAFEIGQASVLMSILTSSQDRKKYTPWILMCILTLVQIIGNVYSSYKYIMLNSPENLKYFKEPIFIWTDLPDAEATVIITYVSAAILPIVALLMTSMITNYLTDQSEENNSPILIPETIEKGPENPPIEIKNKKEFYKVYGDDDDDELDGPPEGEGLSELQEIDNLNVALDKKDEEIEQLKKQLKDFEENPLINEHSILQMENQGLEESNKKKDEEIDNLKKELEKLKNDQEKENSQQGLPESNVELTRTTEVQRTDGTGGEATTTEDKSNNDVDEDGDENKIDENKIDESEQYKLDNEEQESLETSDGQTEDTITEDVQTIEEEPKKPSHFINL